MLGPLWKIMEAFVWFFRNSRERGLTKIHRVEGLDKNLDTPRGSNDRARQFSRFTGKYMTKSVCVLAILAAAISTSAVAKDLKQDNKATAAPTISAAQMTDSEMDKVTGAGVISVQNGHVSLTLYTQGQATYGILSTPHFSNRCIGPGC
jgi:hypothetical protein